MVEDPYNHPARAPLGGERVQMGDILRAYGDALRATFALTSAQHEVLGMQRPLPYRRPRGAPRLLRHLWALDAGLQFLPQSSLPDVPEPPRPTDGSRPVANLPVDVADRHGEGRHEGEHPRASAGEGRVCHSARAYSPRALVLDHRPLNGVPSLAW